MEQVVYLELLLISLPLCCRLESSVMLQAGVLKCLCKNNMKNVVVCGELV